MITRFKKLFAAPIFEDEEKTSAARLVNVTLFTILALMVALPLIIAFAMPSEAGITLAASAVMVVIVLGLLFLVRRGYVRIVSVLLTSMFLIMITWSIYSYRGVRDITITGYFLVLVLASLLLGGREVMIFGAVCILAVLAVYYAEISGAISVTIEDTPTLFQLIALITVFVLATLLLRFAVNSIARGSERARRAAQALAESNRALEASRDALEARTCDLEQRSAYLEATADVGRAAASILDTDQLIKQVVELIRTRFDLYYVGLFLVEGEWAVLRAGAAEAGRAMLARGHRIRIGEGMIGWSIVNAQARIASRAEADAVRLATDELPDTRSEAALPLRSRGRVIGAFTVQSDQSNAFDDPGTIAVLQTMADQVAVALDNARLFTTSQEALETARRAYGELSRQAWLEQLSTRAVWGYRYVDQSIAHAEGDWQPEMLRAAQTGQSVQTDGEGEPALAIPIKIRDQVVGTLGLRKAETGGTWTAEETALLEALTEQLGRALESARLYQDTRRRATREQVTREITDKMRQATDMESLLRITAEQLNSALGAAQTYVRLDTRDTVDDGAE